MKRPLASSKISARSSALNFQSNVSSVLLVAKAGGFDAPLDQPVAPSLQLVVNEQADEIERSQVFGSGLLRSDRKRVGHAAEAQLPKRAVQFVGGHEGAPCVSVVK